MEVLQAAVQKSDRFLGQVLGTVLGAAQNSADTHRHRKVTAALMSEWQREAKAGTGETRESMEVNQKAATERAKRPFVGGYFVYGYLFPRQFSLLIRRTR